MLLQNKIIYSLLLFVIGLIACDNRSDYRKAADEIALKMGDAKNMNVGTDNYALYIPAGWITDSLHAYGVDYFFLVAPKTKDDPNTNISVTTEFMQNLSLDVFKTLTIESVTNAIPSATILEQGDIIANDLKGGWYSYSMESYGIKSTLVSYIFPKDGIAYTITAGTQTKDAARYRNTFDSVARSLKFIE